MIYLVLSILASTGTFFGMRYTESHNGNRYVATFATFVVCTLLSFVLMEDKRLFYNSDEGLFTLFFAMFNGVCMAAGMILIRMSTGINGTPVTGTFSKVGVMIPTVVSAVIFSEIPSVIQIVGIAMALFAMIYINGGEDSHIRSIKLLLAVFTVKGTADLNTKLFDVYGDSEMKALYTFYTFFFCMVISFIIVLIKDKNLRAGDIIAGAITGIPNQLGLYFNLLAVAKLPTYIVFPMLSAGVILLVNIINYALFREKLSSHEKRSMIIIGAALILINL